jgi:divalent metal cation (Fe/Co/Zn/Cd) transporter
MGESALPALLFVLAAYVLVNAAYSLWRREGQEFSPPRLILAVLAIPVMWWLARAKMRVAAQIGSRALRAADAHWASMEPSAFDAQAGFHAHDARWQLLEHIFEAQPPDLPAKGNCPIGV